MSCRYCYDDGTDSDGKCIRDGCLTCCECNRDLLGPQPQPAPPTPTVIACLTVEKVEQVTDIIDDCAPDCSHVTRDNKRCCMCDGCIKWMMGHDIADKIEKYYEQRRSNPDS